MRTVAWLVAALGAGCGDDLRPPDDVGCASVRTPDSVDLQDVSTDGRVAYTDDVGTLYVTQTACDGGAEAVDDDVGAAWFCGPALLAFHGVANADQAASLWMWTPGDIAPLHIGDDVDPGATHCSPDGRYFSTELDDRPDDSIQPRAVVVSTTDGRLRVLGSDHNLRVRFTHDSQRVVYSVLEVIQQMPLPLDDATGEPITSTSGDRWEISPDDAWLVYSPDYVTLARHPLGEGSDTILATGLGYRAGKEFDLASDGESVAFVSWNALSVVPAAGGDVRELVTSDPGAPYLVDNYPGAVIYVDGALYAIDPGGGTPVDLGVSKIVDHNDGGLLLQDGETIAWMAIPPTMPVELADDALGAALAPDGRVVLAHDVVESIDPATGTSEVLLDERLVDFIADHGWFAGALESPDGTLILRRSLVQSQ